MKDFKYVVICVVIGLGLAHFVGAPLRKPAHEAPLVGTPLHAGQAYAKGTLNVSANSNIKPGDYAALFILARPLGTRMPIAVKKIDAPSFPLSFELTEANNMAGEGFFEGDITLVARLDRDGVAGPLQETDIETSVDIKQGQSRGVDLTFKR